MNHGEARPLSMGDLWPNGRKGAHTDTSQGVQDRQQSIFAHPAGARGEVKCVHENRQDSFRVASWKSRSQKRGRTELGREENGEPHLLHSQE